MTNIICAGTRYCALPMVARIVGAAGAADHPRAASLSSINSDLLGPGHSGPQAPWPLAVVSEPGLPDQAREQLSAATATSLWTDRKAIAALDFWREVDATLRFLLVFSRPEDELAAYLLRQEAPVRVRGLEPVLQRWQRTTLAMLRFASAHRGCVMLINGRSAGLAPRTLITKLNAAWGLGFGPGPGPDERDRPGPLQRTATAVCRSWIDRLAPEAKAVGDEARALATDLIPADVEATGPAVDTIDLQLAQQLAREADNQQTRLSELEAERTALCDTVAQLTAERDDAAERLRTVTDERQLAQRFIDQLEAQIRTLHGTLDRHNRQARELARRQNVRAAFELVGELRSLQR